MSQYNAAHWKRWGFHIANRLQSRLLPRSAYDTVLKAQEQAQELARQMAPDANIYLEGSVVTTGLLEKGSDLDLSCVLDSVGSLPDAKLATKLSDKLYHRIKYSIPSACNIKHIDMVRIPLVKYVAQSSPVVLESVAMPLTGERARNARTGAFHFAFALSPEKESALKGLMKKAGCELEQTLTEHAPGGGNTTFTFTAASTNQLFRCIGVLPDGKTGIITKSMKAQYSRAVANLNDLPELLRFSFDITFLGYAVRNSYLIRKYLHDPNGPSVSRLCQMTIKRWGKATEFGVGAKGNLTSYGMTIMWIYYLLRTGQVGWFDPWRIPDACHLPRYPDFTPWPNFVDYEELGSQIFEFFRFYSTFDWKNEVISLTQDRVRRREDVRWMEKRRERFHFNMCLEDPYEDDLNCARRIDARKLEWFRNLVQEAITAMLGPPEGNLNRILGKP